MQVEKVHQHLIGKKYSDVISALEIEEDQGDCCGYASCELPENIPENPDNLVLVDCVQHSYEEEDFDRVVLNFVFKTEDEKELILGYDLSAGSGSGWCYGAYVNLKLSGEVLAYAIW